MDRNTLTGLFLIGAILLTFSLFNNKEPEDEQQKEENVEAVEETTNNNVELVKMPEDLPADSVLLSQLPDSLQSDSSIVANYLDSIKVEHALAVKAAEKENTKNELALEREYGSFAGNVATDTSYTVLENDNIIVKFSNVGGRIVEVKMKQYETYADYVLNDDSITPMALFDEQYSAQYLSMVDKNSGRVSTSKLNFETDAPALTLVESEPGVVKYRAYVSEDKYLEYQYTLEKGAYEVGFRVEFYNLGDVIDLGKSSMVWSMRGLATEKTTYDERMTATVMYRYFNEKRTYLSERSTSEAEFEARTNWVAFKHKFFSSVLISEEGWNNGTVKQAQLEGDDYSVEYYTDVSLPTTSVVEMKFFFGPNEYDLLASYDNGMVEIINHGWGIFGWVNKWLIRPIFNILNNGALSMGLIIFLVTLLVKVIITPLTYRNYLSSARMRVLKPEIEAINNKYPGQDQMMKRQQETQALYRSSGVNPMAGCLPMLIQMPILLAVFRFFPSSIELRQEAFLWAEDMSSYDSILSWTGDIPVLSSIYGNHVSLFTLLMAASTMIYTIMNSNSMAQPTQPGMPNMKVIMYIFPVMMIFFFNSFSAGLSYYYLCGNLFNIGIMWGIKKYMIDEDKIRATIAENKKKPVKKSKFMQRLEEVQKQQAQQRNKKK